jgi:hypothetical protein
MILMEELRAAMFAFLSFGGTDWEPLRARLGAAMDRVERAPPPVLEIEALLAEFRAAAVREGKPRFADSPLYPYGIPMYVEGLLQRLRPHCGSKWRRQDTSTEPVSSWCWVSLPRLDAGASSFAPRSKP